MTLTEDLENSIDIVDLVGRYTKLKKAGANYKALCPFPGHTEKTPSFLVSPTKQIAYCFGCHKGGGAIKFIMDIENCEFRDAVEILGNLTGISVKKFQNKSEEEIKAEKNLYSLYKNVGEYYKKSLEKYSNIKKYLFDRGLNSESLNNFLLGYSDDGISLYNYLKECKFDDNLIKESGIFVNFERRKDKFLGRIIFPIKNNRGDIVAFAGRIIDKGEPKYLNSVASKIYDKSSILFGLYEARSEITKKDFVIITEGYMDTISLHQYGYKNVVAVSGTALTEKHLTILKRLTKKIFLCFDNDSAGQNATKLSLDLLKNKGFEVKIIQMEGGKDPDEILKSGGNFQEFIDNAISPIGFYFKNLKVDLNSFTDKENVLKEILEIIKTYSNNIEKDFYIKEISRKLEIPTNLVYEELNKKKETRETIKESQNIAITSEDYLISYIVNDENAKKIIKENLIFVEYLPQNLKNILENDDFLKNLSLEKKEFYRGLAFELEQKGFLVNAEKIENDLKKLCQKINSDIYKNKIKEFKDVLAKDSNNIDILMKYNEFVKKAKELRIV